MQLDTESVFWGESVSFDSDIAGWSAEDTEREVGTVSSELHETIKLNFNMLD